MKNIFIVALLCLCLTNSKAQLKFKKDFAYHAPRSFACNFFTTTGDYVPPSASNVSKETEMKWMNDMVKKILGIVGL